MGNRERNLEQLRLAAQELQPLLGRLVFLGGCTTGLYITDVASADVRPTKDVDVIVEVGSRTEYHAIESELRDLGFSQPMTEDCPICRWHKDSLVVDVMPTEPEILGFSNRWYPDAIRTAESVNLGKAFEIQVVAGTMFVATKIEAFEGRGKGDFYQSPDMEDLLAVIDGRETLAAEIRDAKPNVREFVAERISAYLQNMDFINALPGLVPDFHASPARADIVMERLHALTKVHE